MRKIEDQKAKHIQLKEMLIDDILNNLYPIGTKIPSVPSLIRQYGISDTTVLKAFSALEHEGYIHREKGRGTFVADYKKNNGLKGKRILGFVATLSGMDPGHLFSNIFYGAEDSAQRHGYEIILRSSRCIIEKEVEYINRLAEMVDGLMILLTAKSNTSDAVISTLHKLQDHVPFVLMERYVKGLNCNYVVTDNFAGTYGAVEYLSKLGHKSILLLSTQDWANVTSLIDRVAGYDQAIKDFDVVETLRKEDESKIFLERHMPYILNYKPVVENIMKVGGRHTAVIATEYYLAAGIIDAAQRMGLKVPDDLAVVGFDEHQVPWRFSVGITTVIQPMYDIGQSAVDVLVDNIENGVKAPENMYLKPKLVVKDSCGAKVVIPV